MTMKDVAEKAGVSLSTVSHVINHTRYVSDELQSRVLAAMKELNYRPNILARGLRQGDTKTIGLVIPDNSNPFFAEISRGIEDIGFKNDYTVMLCNSDDDVEKEEAYINTLIAKQVDGIIFIASGSKNDLLNDITNEGIPVVLADRDSTHNLVDVVLVDNQKGGYKATKYLLDLGHTQIACITGPSELTPSADRVKGYRSALAEAGIEFKKEYVISGDFRCQSGDIAIRRLLELVNPPTAVFACNDMMAFGALRALRDAKISVPEEISVIGFDNIPMSSVVTPSLSTIAQPIDEIAEITTELLLNRIRNRKNVKETQRIILEPVLIERESTGALEK